MSEEKEGTVNEIAPLFVPSWWMVKLKEEKELFALHNNWFFNESNPKQPKTLKTKDKVQYVISNVKFEGYPLFDKLEKIESKEELEEAGPEL